MKTYKEIATITYCSNEYLDSQLKALVNMGDIECWFYINHKKEDVTLKDHTHLFILPIVKLETRDLQFKENDIQGTMPYKKSDFGNWYFYSVHNPLYLQSKGLEKKYHYNNNDYHCSDYPTFMSWVQSLDISEYIGETDNVKNRIRDAVYNCIPFSKLVSDGWIPINQIRNYEKFYSYITQEKSRLEAINLGVKNEKN